MKNIVFLLFVTFILFSCSKVPMSDPRADSLIGSWTYISSSGGFSGGIESSELQQGDWVKYTSGGQYEVYSTTGLKRREKFTLIEDDNSISELRIQYRNKFAQHFKCSSDTLILYDDGSDMFMYVFVKK